MNLGEIYNLGDEELDFSNLPHSLVWLALAPRRDASTQLAANDFVVWLLVPTQFL